MWLLIIVFAPVILVAGEPANRHGDRSVRVVAPSRLPLLATPVPNTSTKATRRV
jgi:hypothetical protein